MRVIGNGGHARVVKDVLDNLVGVVNRPHSPDGVVIAIGDNRVRRELFEQLGGDTIIHWSAIVSPTAEIGKGAQIMAGAVIQAYAKIGMNTIVNTKASVDHDCIIGDHCHIAPGAVLCGSVVLGDGCFIGAGSVIVQGVKLNAGTFIPAGSLVAEQNDIRRPLGVVSGERPSKGDSGKADLV